MARLSLAVRARLARKPGELRRLTKPTLAKAITDTQVAHEVVNTKITRHYRLRLQHWLARLFPGMESVAQLILKQHTNPNVAAARLMAVLTPDPRALAGLRQELEALYTDSYVAGLAHATKLVSGGTLTMWEPWRPLAGVDAQHVTGEGLSLLLGGTQALAQGLADTQRERAGDVLAAAVREAQNGRQLAFRLRHLQAAHAQAEVAATTEAARAQLVAATDVLRAAGVPAFIWVTEPDACPACKAMREASPHAVGSEIPPLHPNCRCSIQPT